MRKQNFLPLLLMVMFVSLFSYAATSAVAGGRTDDHSHSVVDRESFTVDTLAEASILAGFQLRETDFDGAMTNGRIEVSRYGPDGRKSFVRRGWADQESGGAILLFEENVLTLMNGGEPRDFAGISGMGQEYPAIGSTPPRMVFSWDEPNGTVTVFAILDGTIDQQAVERLVRSLDC